MAADPDARRTPAGADRGWLAWLPALFVLLVLGLLSGRLLSIIDANSVNVLFWDQWDLMEPVMEGAGPWELFRFQHGPHRQGVAFVLSATIAELTAWNTRADAFSIGAIICLAAAAALWLARRLHGTLSFGDAAIPLLMLTPAQYGIFIHTPNASHSAAPLLLLVLYCVALTVTGRVARYAIVLVLNFALIHTGFGVFAGILTPLYFGAEAWRSRTPGSTASAAVPLACLGIALLSAASFFVDYVFDPAVEGFEVRTRWLASYLRFVALMLANVCGVKGLGPVPALIGYVCLLFAVGIAGWHGASILRRKRDARSDVVVVLILFGLLYCANTAVGRLSMGLPSAQSTRYVPLTLPLFLGMLLHIRSVRARWLQPTLQLLSIVALLAATFPMREPEARFMRSLHARKTRWVEIYRTTHDIETANRGARIKIYPWPPPTTRLQEKLDFLEARRLNLFGGNSRPRRSGPGPHRAGGPPAN